MCFLFTLPLQILLSTVFPKESSIWFVFLAADRRVISSRPSHSEQVCSIVLDLLYSFPEKFTQEPTRSSWRDICGLYFWHFANFHLWLAIFAVLRLGKDSRYGFKFSRKYRRLAFVYSLLVRLIWFCETAKLSKSVLSNFKKWPNTIFALTYGGKPYAQECIFQQFRPSKITKPLTY